MQGGENGAAFLVPAPNEVDQVGRGLGVDRVERLVQHDQARILQQQPREQHALHLPTGQCADRAPLEACQTNRRQCGFNLVTILFADAAKQSGLAPQSHRHKVIDRDWEAPIDLGGLRQIGDIARRQTGKIDMTRQRLDRTDNALEQGRLAGTVRADDGQQRARRHLSAQVMHRRMTIITEGQIAELKLRVHQCSAQNTAAQIAAISADTTTRRSNTDSRRIDGAIAAGGCACPSGWW